LGDPGVLSRIGIMDRDEEKSLLQAICAAPLDRVVRRVYADWLEEQGLPSRADFLRFELAAEEHQARGEPIPPEYMRDRRPTLTERANWIRELPKILGVQWQDLFRGGFPAGVTVANARVFLDNAEQILSTIPVWSLRFLSAEGPVLERIAREGYLRHVGQLDLHGTRIGGFSQQLLTEPDVMPYLETLFIGQVGMTDPVLVRIARQGQVPQLTWLDLSGNPVTERSVRELLTSPRFPNLIRLGLQDTRVDPLERVTFRQILAERNKRT
jgi:uncharacterized protein (TIGR02996 family)